MVNKFPPVAVLGEGAQSGAYLLRIQVAEAVDIVFGKFLAGRPLLVPAGAYVYIGSAGGVQGSATLAHRSLRHATRGADGPPHAIRDPLLAALRAHHLGRPGLQPPSRKKLFWHIDFLLESPAAALSHILILCSDRRMEKALARRLVAEPEVRVLVKGLGARDTPGATHVLQVPDRTAWWGELVRRIRVEYQYGHS
jgi:Uri superfamily endonuclease